MWDPTTHSKKVSENKDYTKHFLTSFLVSVSTSGLPESHQGSEVGSQHSPAEGCHRVDSHQAADEGVLAAFEQGHNVRTHVVGVLLPEVLNEGKTHMHPVEC